MFPNLLAKNCHPITFLLACTQKWNTYPITAEKKPPKFLTFSDHSPCLSSVTCEAGASVSYWPVEHGEENDIFRFWDKSPTGSPLQPAPPPSPVHAWRVWARARATHTRPIGCFQPSERSWWADIWSGKNERNGDGWSLGQRYFGVKQIEEPYRCLRF